VYSWSLVIAAALMGGALLTTVWTAHRGVGDASEMLERGQSALLQESIRARLAELEEMLTSAHLAEILAEMEPEGLRYLAAFDRYSDLVAEAGTPPPDRAELGERPRGARGSRLVPAGDRLRVVLRRWPRPLGRWWQPSDAWPRRTGPFVIEFEPKVAAELRAATGKTLAVGALAAGGLLLGALVLVRWILHRAALERSLERERHLASLGEMSAVLAHEIRNPLASLKGNAQLLARTLPGGDKPHAKAERVVSEAIRLERLTNDLLEFARTGAIRREDSDPAEIARDAAVAQTAGERIELDTADAPERWSLDPARMRQVLSNLIENALMASGEEAVTVTVSRDAGQLLYEVRDRGPGIASDDLPHIFDPFYTRRTTGTGLGLAVSRRLVELHGGSIEARNHPDGGAELRVSLPEV
jgi:two-component system sensor histidine kinase HydH